MFTDKEIVEKRIRETHEMRENNIILSHKIEKNVGKYSNSMNGEMKRFQKVMRTISEYFNE